MRGLAALQGFGGITRALRHRDYRLFSAGASGSYLGTWVYRTGLGWFTWELTESTTWLGIVVFVEVIPHLTLVPITGAIVDRVGALRIAKPTQFCATVVMTAFAILAALDLVTIEILLVFVFLNGLIMAVHQPSYFALVANLVPREDLSAAVALQSSLVQTARFLGPAIAGGLIIWLGVATAFAVNAISYVGMFAALLAIRMRDPPRQAAARGWLFADIAEGLRFVAGHFAIRTILLITVLLSMMLRPVIELMPGFASEVFGRGADGLAWLMSASGVGAIFGSLWIARRGSTVGLTRIYSLTAVVASLALLAFARTDVFWLGVGAVVVFGLFSNVNSICSQILIQNSVAPEMRARVMSLVGLTFRGVPAASAALLGWLASLYGLDVPFTVTAVIGLFTGFLVFALIRRADLAHHAENAPSDAG